MQKHTKVVCTIGPASKSREILGRMMAAGMDVARLNFSHGTYEDHTVLLKNIRAAARKAHKVITIIQDLQGPRIRLGEVVGTVIWKERDTVVLDGTTKKNTGAVFPVTYRGLHKDIKKGARILVEDGKKVLRVTAIKGTKVHCIVVTGGPVISHKGLNFPDSRLSVDPITEKDREDLHFGLRNDVDYVVMSFVSDARQINRLRRMMGKRNAHVGIIAKVEMAAALKNIEEIIKAADAVMIGRGDLALEIDYADVPVWQKRIIELSRQAAKPVIVATQMMESMMKKGARASRADVSDVANAVFDRTDAVMLSGETAMGEDPVAIVKTMSHIIEEAERSMYDDVLVTALPKGDFGVAVREYAESIHADSIQMEKSTVRAARLISRARLELPLFFATKDERLVRSLNLSWGIANTKPHQKYSHPVHVVKENIADRS